MNGPLRCVCGQQTGDVFPVWAGGTCHRTEGPCYQAVAYDDQPAEHVATLVARSPGRVVSMICSCGVSVVGDVMPFAAVTRLMLEHLNGEKAAAQELSIVDDQRPHSRACSLSYHTHGLTCAPSCPTCHGSEPTVSPFDPANR